ncbi:hypothetical protein, partial [Pseudomonas sp. KB_12]|uniref:hypothetical protein n=1 Tax=Pseudomonas sp. KB_12 TaxID=3233034 RepID=UPI003F9D5E74
FTLRPWSTIILQTLSLKAASNFLYFLVMEYSSIGVVSPIEVSGTIRPAQWVSADDVGCAAVIASKLSSHRA